MHYYVHACNVTHGWDHLRVPMGKGSQHSRNCWSSLDLTWRSVCKFSGDEACGFQAKLLVRENMF